MTEPDFFDPASISFSDNDSEAELHRELQAMFEIDSQNHLQTYIQLIQQLNSSTWVADIQTLYRAIHTIKGSAVTVGADAVVHTAMVLEDLLSDLRYLEEAPPLEDGQIHQMLLEAGELLGSCMQLPGADTQISIAPIVNRIKTLHEQIQVQYIPNWDALNQVHQEFALQGFDLVVLDLEMVINQLCEQDVPSQAQATAGQVLAQLQQIGQDLTLGEEWITLLQSATQLRQVPIADVWRQQWPIYFDLLKSCAKQSGQLTPEQQNMATSLLVALPDSAKPPEVLPIATVDPSLGYDMAAGLDLETGFGSGDWELELDLETLVPLPFADPAVPGTHLNENVTAEVESADLSDEFLTAADGMDFDSFLEVELDESVPIDQAGVKEPEAADLGIDISTPLPGLFPPPEQSAQSLTPPVLSVDSAVDIKGIKIPVPLERLNQSSQQVVETLLTVRSAVNESSTLQTQLSHLTVLTQESAQYISRLRQLQNDYAFLQNISDVQAFEGGLNLERYRQGYTTINRLLENVLRMSELGAELEGTAQQTVDSLEQLNRNVSRLKDGIETNRLVPFSNLTLRARAILRDLTSRYTKPARLKLVGEQVELDAGVVQQLEPALLHLLRNAYDHGIESRDERLSQGKPEEATIQITLERQGNLYRLLLQDDGRGIDGQKVSRIAQERGFALTQIQNSADLVAVLCQPGFSSRDTVSEVSGRGVGMDVVANQIASIGGCLHVETQLGQGTTFILEIPAPQLLVPCILLQVGRRTVALPTDDIREIMMAGTMHIQPPQKEDASKWDISTDRGMAPGYGLAEFWHQPTAVSDTTICIRTRPFGTEHVGDAWLIADDLLGQEELLIQPLPHPLVSPPALLGVSLQADGRLLSVLDPVALAETLATQNPVVTTKQKDEGAKALSDAVPTILVVDDAALMRRRLESSLNNYGFVTFTCSDGEEAWKWLQANGMPDLMITDVEMPNMDGFTLIDCCRQSDMEMPIIVVSSRLSEEWGKEAKRLGANDYLNKGFSTPVLINRVKAYLNQQPAKDVLSGHSDLLL